MPPRTLDRSRTARTVATAHRAVSAGTIAALALPLLAVAIAAPTPARAATHAVDAGDGFFSPASLTVQVGDTVTWTNADDSPHTVTGDIFDSGNLDAGQTFSFTFTEAGTFDYICMYHDGMAGTVTVAAASSAPSPSTAAPSAPAPSQATGAGQGGGAQPDTAVPVPSSGPWAWVAALLIGVGMVALAVGFVPERGTVSASRGRGAARAGGWRR